MQIGSLAEVNVESGKSNLVRVKNAKDCESHLPNRGNRRFPISRSLTFNLVPPSLTVDIDVVKELLE